MHDVIPAVVLGLGAWLGWHLPHRRQPPKRPGYINHRPGFGRGINHPTFTEIRRGMREARRMRRGRY